MVTPVNYLMVHIHFDNLPSGRVTVPALAIEHLTLGQQFGHYSMCSVLHIATTSYASMALTMTNRSLFERKGHITYQGINLMATVHAFIGHKRVGVASSII